MGVGSKAHLSYTDWCVVKKIRPLRGPGQHWVSSDRSILRLTAGLIASIVRLLVLCVAAIMASAPGPEEGATVRHHRETVRSWGKLDSAWPDTD